MGFKVLVRINSVGYSGHLWLMCSSDTIEVSMLDFSTQLIHCLMRIIDGNYEALMTFVYANPRL